MHALAGALMLLAGVSAAAGIVAAAELERTSLRAEAMYGWGADSGAAIETALELTPALELAFSSTTRWVMSARARFDPENRLAPGEPDTSTYSPLSRPWIIGDDASVELRDAYLEVGVPRGRWRFGKQQIVWGALDGVKILDALNPQSFREFILDDFEESRIGLFAAYADLSFGSWRAELAWLPDATAHEIPVRGAWFEFRAPRFRFGAARDVAPPPTVTERPANDFEHSAIGARLSRLLGDWDLALVALSGQDFEPLARLVPSPAGPRLERYYERRDLIGVSAATSFGRYAVRAELAWRPDRVFNLRRGDALSTAALDQVSAGVGIDVEGPFGTFVNIQYIVDRVRSAPDGLVRPAEDRLMTVFVRRSFAYDTVTTGLRWYGDVGVGDGLLRAEAAWLVTDETSLTLALDLFEGPVYGLFGQFEARDRVTIALEHWF